MSKCKYGAWITGGGEEAGESVTNVARAAGVAESTVRLHRRQLCRCYTVAEAVAPGATDAGLKGLPKPSLEYNEAGGTFITAPRPASEGTPGEAELFAEYDLDPADWQIVSIGKSKRQANSGEWFESCRASFKPRRTVGAVEGLSADEMEDIIRRVTARTLPYDLDGSAYFVPFGDLQAGKKEAAGGTAELLERFAGFLAQAHEDYVNNWAGGISAVVLPWLGDCIEGITSQGGRLATRQDLSVTEQVRLVQRLMLLAIETFAPDAPRVIVAVVPGNHDESTRQFATVGSDSWAVHAAASVADTIKAVQAVSPDACSNVEFIFPQRDKLTVTFDVAGTRITCLHGHQFRGGLSGAEKWAAGHALGRQPEGSADLFLCGHLHHFEYRTVGNGQSIVQIDALDGGSQWFADRTGSNQPAGLCSLVVRDGKVHSLTRYYETEEEAA